VKGEPNSRHLWNHIKRLNRDFAHKVARTIANICSKYPGSVLLFERLRTIRSSGTGKTRRLNRKLANQIRGLIRDYTKEKAFATSGTVTVEVNPHGTSQYCSCCGAKGERFSHRCGQRVPQKGGKLFYCKSCHYEANADFNASVNMHHSFYREHHWQPKQKPSSREGTPRSARLQVGRKKHSGGTPR
jgi:putative transposase